MPRAFHLAVGVDRLATLTFDLPSRKVNLLDHDCLEELDRLVADLALRREIGCLVLCSSKPGSFVAGADLATIAEVVDPVEAEAGSRFGHRIFSAWESLPFPTIAAIEGTCLGGGTDLALASTYRVVADREDLRIGMPEVELGLVPGWGGCVRLPRLVGLSAALDLILSAQPIDARRSLRLGLADAVLPAATFATEVRRFAAAVADRPRPRARRSGPLTLLLEGNRIGRALLIEQARRRVLRETRGHEPAPLRALAVIRTGLDRGRAAGFDAEARAIGELATSAVAKNLLHLFRLREARRRALSTPDAPSIDHVAVIGAGTLGAGLARLVVDRAAVPVRLRDSRPEALGAAMGQAAARFRRQVDGQEISPPELSRRLALLRPTTDASGLARADLAIEAGSDELASKQRLVAELDAQVPPTALLATTTSSLSVAAIGAGLPGRQRLVGLHFLPPVDRGGLVEVVAASSTAESTIEATARFVARLGKTPIVVTDSPGFLVHRLLGFYSAEALWLLDEGAPIEAIDGAMHDWGMPMGPLRLADEGGLETLARMTHLLREAFPDRFFVPAWLDRIPDNGRLGVHSGRGLYQHETGREPRPDPSVYDLIGVVPGTRPMDRSRLLERMLLPLVNEAARCLEEGVVGSAGDLDLALILGSGFPPFSGGLARWADEQGLDALVERLRALAGAHGPRFEPSAALLELAARGGFHAEPSRPAV